MGNYSLVINSKFNPFSYQEMLAPVLMATQAHQELENQYGELEAKANIWENLANEQTDPYAYKMYKTFANDLEEKAELLAKEGLNASSRKNMLNMRARYNKEITPIETAYKRREELAAEQRKLSASNPTMFYQRKASSMSLDDLIRNPSMDYGERYSGALLAQQVGQMAANLKTALTGKGKLKGIGLPYQYEQLLQQGYTPEQIQQAITNPHEGNPVLNTIVEQALNASGMKNWASPEQLAQARAYANQGLYNAIGKTEFKNFTDSFSMQDALARRAERRAADRQRQEQSHNLAINPLNIYSSREKIAAAIDRDNNIRKYSKYFTTDATGKTVLNKEGMALYKEGLKKPKQVASHTSSTTGTSVPVYSSVAQDFRIFIDTLNKNAGGKYITNKNRVAYIQPGNIGNLWNQYKQSSLEGRYDATKVTEFDYIIEPAQQALVKDAISEANRGKKNFNIVDYDPTSELFKQIGSISTKDFKENYTVLSTRFSPYGSTAIVQNKVGDVVRIHMPLEINPTNEYNRDALMQYARVLQQHRKGGTFDIPQEYADLFGIPKENRKVTASAEQIQNEYSKVVQQAYMYHSQLFGSYGTSKHTFNMQGY